jgi:hypothetical protein
MLVSAYGLADTTRMHGIIYCSHFQVLMSILSSMKQGNSEIHASILIVEKRLRNDLNAKDISA